MSGTITLASGDKQILLLLLAACLYNHLKGVKVLERKTRRAEPCREMIRARKSRAKEFSSVENAYMRVCDTIEK